MNFKEFKLKFQQSLPQTNVALFQVDVPKEMLWDTFINAFSPELRAEYTCNCCRSFIRAYGNIVALVDFKPKSIWEIPGLEGTEFENVAKQMTLLVSGEKIRNAFVTETRELGTDSNIAFLAPHTKWDHMYFQLDKLY